MFKIFALLGVLGSRANVLRPCFEHIYDAPDTTSSYPQDPIKLNMHLLAFSNEAS